MACHTGRAPTRWPGRKADSSAGRSAQRSPVRTLCPHRRSRPPVGSRSIIATRLPARPSAHARCSSRTLAPRPPRAPVTARTWAGRPERAAPGLLLLSLGCVSAPDCAGSPAEGLRGGKETSRPSHTGLRPVAGLTRAACLTPAPSVTSDAGSFSSGSGAAAPPDAATTGMVSVSSDCADVPGSCSCPGCHAPSPAGTGVCLTGISTGIALSFRFPYCLPGPAHGRPLPRPLPQPSPGSAAGTPHEWYGGTAAPPPAALHQGAGPPAAAPSDVVGPVEEGRKSAPVAPRPPRPTAPHRGPGPPSAAASATTQATAGLTRLTPELPS